MAYRRKFSLGLAAAVMSVLLVGCNSSNSDTAEATAAATTVSNTGTYAGGFDSPVKLLCVDAPGLDPTGHGACGQRYTLFGSVSLIVSGDTITGGNVSVYGYESPLTAASKIDGSGNFTFSHGHINGKGNVVNGVMTGTVWEGPYEWKYGEFKFTKPGGGTTTTTTTTASGDIAAFAGSYAGTVAGGAANQADNGTFEVAVDSNGKVTGNTIVKNLPWTLSGSVDANGNLTMGLFGSGVQYHNWIGTINKTTGAINGTWSHSNGDGVSGTFAGSKR